MKNKSDFRNDSPISLNKAITDMYEAFHLKKKVDKATILSTWEETMGKTIASRTLKMYFKENTLFVELSSAPLKQELNFAKEKILERFVEQFGEGVVKDIVFL